MTIEEFRGIMECPEKIVSTHYNYRTRRYEANINGYLCGVFNTAEDAETFNELVESGDITFDNYADVVMALWDLRYYYGSIKKFAWIHIAGWIKREGKYPHRLILNMEEMLYEN